VVIARWAVSFIRRNRHIFILAAILIVTSGALYYLHYRVFHDTYHIFFYLLGDLAFLPLEVLIVVVVIERVLASREKQILLKKLNMVIGAFFSELGNRFIADLIPALENQEAVLEHLAVSANWKANDFKRAASYAETIKVKADCRGVELLALKDFLTQKREFLLRLLENPILLEHDAFTDLLWAVSHLAEELEARPNFTGLPEADLAHLAGDIQRVYGRLVSEWVRYLEHLKQRYPFLFSLVLRTHPFQPHPSPVVS
jgi:hypothetical protein